MFTARNHTEFNAAMNKAAGTNNVAYSPAWDMATTSGRDYMSRAYDTVGRIYAGVRLGGGAQTASKLCTAANGSHATPMQKVALSAMQNSRDIHAFDAAVRAAAKHGAINSAATAVFSMPSGVRTVSITALPVDRMHTTVGAADSGAHMDTAVGVADIAQPAAITVDATPTTKRRKGKK